MSMGQHNKRVRRQVIIVVVIWIIIRLDGAFDSWRSTTMRVGVILEWSGTDGKQIQ
jgi:hypothetical protein